MKLLLMLFFLGFTVSCTIRSSDAYVYPAKIIFYVDHYWVECDAFNYRNWDIERNPSQMNGKNCNDGNEYYNVTTYKIKRR